jgi:hypothetical protein
MTVRRLYALAAAVPALMLSCGLLLTVLSLERGDPTAKTVEFALLPLAGLAIILVWRALARRARTTRP